MHNLKFNRAVSLGALCFLVLMAISLTFASGAEDPGGKVLQPHSEVKGRTLGEWSAVWWKWAYGIPTNDNPVYNDTNGAKAKFGDVVPVFFLAGAFSGTVRRTATVPAEEFVFFPVLNFVNDNVGNPTRFTIDDLSSQLAGAIATITELHASVDGVTVPNLSTHREVSPVFSYTLQLTGNVQQTVFGNTGPDAVGTVFPAVADGIYLMLKPLSPGHHSINFGGTSAFGSLDVTYDLTVTETEVEQPAVLVP
jgi:hypothetical protein